MNAFTVVDQFECRVAEFAGSKYAVSLMTGTWAIFLACKRREVEKVILPARTFISVPMAVIQAGGSIEFDDLTWNGTYRFRNDNIGYDIIDGALRWKRGMYKGGLHMLSFQARKRLPIGEGGMILTDDASDADWLRKARYSGRSWPHFRVEDIDQMGWQAYMTPEKAARGLHLMEYTQDYEDQIVEYPDLRNVPFFKRKS